MFVLSPGTERATRNAANPAINHHAAEGYHRAVVKVWMPPKPKARERWLTREEATSLLWALWRYRETQTIHAGDANEKRSPRTAIRSGTSRASSLLAFTPVHAAVLLHRRRRHELKVGRLSISSAESIFVWRRGRPCRKSARRPRLFRRACWHICGVGFASRSQMSFSSNGVASRLSALTKASVTA